MKDLIECIKEYSTRDFIYYFANESISMFNNQINSPTEEPGCCKKYILNTILHGFVLKKAEIILSAWDINELAYLSIVNANDYKEKTIQPGEVGIIVNLYRWYENKQSECELIKNPESTDVFKNLMGMTYEQFKYQTLTWTYQSFNRNYHMLIGSKKINREKIMDINEITKELFGLSADEFLMVELMILWLCSKHPDPLSAPEQIYRKKNKSILTKENLKKIISYYSVSYIDVRESTIKKQLFYSKPFVVTQKKQETIAVSIYLVQMLMADGLYWLIRDYYRDKKESEFINAFGKMFEDYFEEIASIYLPEKSWYKIPEKKKKSADYFVEVDEAVFLFELKSGLLGIGAKQQMPDVQQIDKFYNRNILKAYEQLKASEQEYEGEKPVIKVFLLYENTTNAQIIMSSIPEIFLEDRRCYIMTIEDWEMMLTTYKNEKEKFDKIVKVLANDSKGDSGYESVLQVLDDYEATNNSYFVEERDYFGKIMNKLDMEMDC